jgi:hypothetical protein
MWSVAVLKRPVGCVVLDLDEESPIAHRARVDAPLIEEDIAPLAVLLPVAPAEAQLQPERQILPEDRAAGQYYLFTVVRSSSPQYKQPDELGRQGLWNALGQAYGTAFKDDHVCHGGPLFGKVARELHAASAEEEQRQPHLHAACAFAVRHRWKHVEYVLRQELRVKAIRVGMFLDINIYSYSLAQYLKAYEWATTIMLASITKNVDLQYFTTTERNLMTPNGLLMGR